MTDIAGLLERVRAELEPFALGEGEPEYQCHYCGDFLHNAHRCRAGSHDFRETGDEIHTFGLEDIERARAALSALSSGDAS